MFVPGKVFIDLNPKISDGFLGVNIKLFSLMLGTVTFSFLRILKIKSFALDSFSESLLAVSQSVSNFSSLSMPQDISEGHLWCVARFGTICTILKT